MGIIHTFTPTLQDHTARALELRADVQKLLTAVPEVPADGGDAAPEVIAVWDAFWMQAQTILDSIEEDVLPSQNLQGLLRETKIHKVVRRLALLPAPSFMPEVSDELTTRCLGLLRKWKTAVSQADAPESNRDEPEYADLTGLPGLIPPTVLQERLRAYRDFNQDPSENNLFSRIARLSETMETASPSSRLMRQRRREQIVRSLMDGSNRTEVDCPEGSNADGGNNVTLAR